MPTISRFHGISIRMYFSEHGIPHFHARYGGAVATYAIASGEVLGGRLPPAADRMVREWATLHHEELMANWRKARAGEPPVPIAPLP